MKLNDIKTILEIIEYTFKVFNLFKQAFKKLKTSKENRCSSGKISNDE